MRYQILDGTTVTNTIEADADYMTQRYPAGNYQHVPDPAPSQKEVILAQLAEIDAKSDSPRARREALLGNHTWLTALDAQAVALRAQLAAL